MGCLRIRGAILGSRLVGSAAEEGQWDGDGDEGEGVDHECFSDKLTRPTFWDILAVLRGVVSPHKLCRP